MNIEHLKLNNPTLTHFESQDIGDSRYVIHKTIIEELADNSEKVCVIDIQIRALNSALEELKKRKAK